MAVTKIWPIKDSVRRVVEYAGNPEKTQYHDLEDVLCYAGNREKTRQDQTVFVTGINCGRDTAFWEMLAVQELFAKVDGNVAYHAYQSFRPGEVTPQQCHQIGIELAQQLWGERHQVLVATHFNTGTFHNHFVLNAVSFVDGKKFNCNRAAYRALSQTSDALCRQYGLSVVEHPSGRTPRSLYFAEKQNAPTRYNLMRQAIDECIAVSPDFRYFAKSLARRGYVLDCTPSHKYPTIRAVGSKKPVRLYRLGEGYSVQEMQKRIFQLAPAVRYPAYRVDRDHYIALRRAVIPKWRVRDSFRHTKKIGGFWALYLHYCYFFGLLPQKRICAPLSPRLQEACRRTRQFCQQLRLVHRAQLYTVGDVERFLDALAQQIGQLQAERNQCYNRLRRCRDVQRRAELRWERDRCTAALLPLYQKRKTARRVLDTRADMQTALRAEHVLRQSLTHPPQQRKRERERKWER